MNEYPSEPWRFLEADDPLDARIGPWTICDADNNDIIDVYSSENSTVNISRGQGIAIAYLIADAPRLKRVNEQLVEALKKARVALNDLIITGWDLEIHGDTLAQVDAALASATPPAGKDEEDE